MLLYISKKYDSNLNNKNQNKIHKKKRKTEKETDCAIL